MIGTILTMQFGWSRWMSEVVETFCEQNGDAFGTFPVTVQRQCL